MEDPQVGKAPLTKSDNMRLRSQYFQDEGNNWLPLVAL